MPLSSAETAAAIGQYQSMYTGSAMHSGMIGGMSSLQGPMAAQGDQVAGGMMSRVQAIGAPMAGLAVGLAGLDPLGMGMRAAGLGSRMGLGMMGAGAMGLGAAGVAAGGAAVVGYAANQLFTGAQQQQQFNQSMRQAFHFQTSQGQGFNNSQLGAISSNIRQMSAQVGPSGEMASFQELSTLASNMGRMGMATGVRDVQEFSRKFKEMVTVVKTVARELGTSLETAQQMASGMRSSGVFKGSEQMRMATEMRQLAVAGNLSVSELSAAANIGSQISRAVGGRGKQGAFAGMRTLGAIGASVQSGAISDEDIYNATGMHGAEGQQALATRQLEQSAGFLKSGRGRRFLASIAGENGQLDATAAAAWEGGDMGIGSTMSATGRQLGKVGRANFIRNEGRLRGAALERFGGNIGAMALTQWAGDKGIDIDSMDDRSMLFASRQLGMGMDELEVAVKQARGAAMTGRASRIAGQNDQQLRREAERRGQQGMAGLKKKFEQAREHVQNKIQQVGADMFTDLSNSIESQLNEMSGVVAEEASKNIDSAYESAKMGDMGAFRKTFGSGGDMRPEAQRMLADAGGRLNGGVSGGILENFTRGGSLTDAIKGGATTGAKIAGFTGVGVAAGALLGGGIAGAKSLLSGGGGVSDYDRMKSAGYGGVFGEGGPKSDLDVTNGMDRIHRIQMAALGPGDPTGEKYGEKLRGALTDLYASDGTSGTSGLDRISAHGKHLEQLAATGNLDAKAALKEFNSRDEAGRAAFVNSVEGKMGLPPGTQLADRMQSPDVGLRGKGFATPGDRAKAIGLAMAGDTSLAGRADQTLFGSALSGAATGAAAGAAIGLVGAGVMAVPGAIIGGIAGGIRGAMNAGEANRTGDFMLTERNSGIARDILGGSEAERKQAVDRLNYDLINLQKNPKANEQKIQTLQQMKNVNEYLEFRAKNPKASPEELAAQAQRLGTSVESLHSAVRGMREAGPGQQEINTRAEAARVGERGRREEQAMAKAGLIVDGKLTLPNGVSGGAAELLTLKFAAVASAARTGKTGDYATEYGNLQETAGHEKNVNDLIWSKSVQERRKMASDLRGIGQFDTAAQIGEINAFQRRADRLIGREGGAGIAKLFGAEFSREEQRSLRGLSGEKLGAQIASRLGLDESSTAGALAEAQKKLDLVKGGPDSKEYKAAQAQVDAAKERLDAAGKVSAISAKLSDKKTRLEGEKELATFQASPEGQKLQKEAQQKQDMNNPVVRGLDKLGNKIATDLGQAADKIANAVKKQGEGADAEG